MILLFFTHIGIGNPENQVEKSGAEDDENATGDVSDKKSIASEDFDKDKTVNAEVLLFGEKLEKAPVGGSIELSSDEDSTEGEEEKSIGNICYISYYSFSKC